MRIADIIAAAKGGPISLNSGTEYLGGSISGVRTAINILGNGAVIHGGLKFANCGPIHFEKASLPDAPAYGVMVVECKSFTGQALRVERAGVTNILTANTSDVLLDGCITNGAKEQHGVYFSQSGDNLRMQNCVSHDNGRSGVQVNAIQDGRAKDVLHDSISQNVFIIGNEFHGNQKVSGASAIQCSGVHTGQIAHNVVRQHFGRNGVALWDDGTNKPNLACWDITIDGNDFEFDPSVKSKVVFNISRNCKRIRIGKNNKMPGNAQALTGPADWF